MVFIWTKSSGWTGRRRWNKTWINILNLHLTLTIPKRTWRQGRLYLKCHEMCMERCFSLSCRRHVIDVPIQLDHLQVSETSQVPRGRNICAHVHHPDSRLPHVSAYTHKPFSLCGLRTQTAHYANKRRVQTTHGSVHTHRFIYQCWKTYLDRQTDRQTESCFCSQERLKSWTLELQLQEFICA